MKVNQKIAVVGQDIQLTLNAAGTDIGDRTWQGAGHYVVGTKVVKGVEYLLFAVPIEQELDLRTS